MKAANVAIRVSFSAFVSGTEEGFDSGRIAAIYGPYVLNTAISFETEPPEEKEMRRRVRDTLEF